MAVSLLNYSPPVRAGDDASRPRGANLDYADGVPSRIAVSLLLFTPLLLSSCISPEVTTIWALLASVMFRHLLSVIHPVAFASAHVMQAVELAALLCSLLHEISAFVATVVRFWMTPTAADVVPPTMVLRRMRARAPPTMRRNVVHVASAAPYAWLSSNVKSSAAAVVVTPMVTLLFASVPKKIRLFRMRHPAAETVIGAATFTVPVVGSMLMRKPSRRRFAVSNRMLDAAAVNEI